MFEPEGGETVTAAAVAVAVAAVAAVAVAAAEAAAAVEAPVGAVGGAASAYTLEDRPFATLMISAAPPAEQEHVRPHEMPVHSSKAVSVARQIKVE